MELPSTLNNKKKLRVSLAIKPGSRGDADSNDKLLTKYITETARQRPEEVQPQKEETTQAAIIVPPDVNSLSASKLTFHQALRSQATQLRTQYQR